MGGGEERGKGTGFWGGKSIILYGINTYRRKTRSEQRVKRDTRQGRWKGKRKEGRRETQRTRETIGKKK